MQKILLSLMMCCLFSIFALADVSHASLTPVKHRNRHHHANHHANDHANRAAKHHVRHRHYRSV